MLKVKKSKKPVPAKSAPKSAPSTIDQNGFSDIREDFDQVLDGVIQRNKKGEVVEALIQVVSEEIFSGPLPHPKHLQAYENICPGAADRILSMAEKSQETQLEIPRRMIDAESGYRILGLKLGFATLISLSRFCCVLRLYGISKSSRRVYNCRRIGYCGSLYRWTAP